MMAACAPAAKPAPAPAPAPRVEEAKRPAKTAPQLFEFHSSFWLNVHQQLHYAATGRRPTPRAAPAAPDAPAWQDAVAFYRERFGDKGGMGIIFDDELVALNRHLSSIGSAAELTGVDGELAAHLRAAGALVRSDWARQDEANRAWVTALEPLLTTHAEGLKADLETVYGMRWPDQPMRADVSCFAGPVGAYTVTDPAHITISSCDERFAGTAALEMIFHEASHVLVGPIETKIDDASKTRGASVPPQLWHAVLFYTTGEMVRRRVGGVPFALKHEIQMVVEVKPALVHAWLPYLDGKTNVDTAIDALVAEVTSRGPE
jgi:hypothetical protein